MLGIEKEIILAFLTPTILGIGWWVKMRREDRLRREAAAAAKELGYLTKIEELQKTLSDWQQERIKDEKNKRLEVDVANKLMLELAALVKGSLKEKEEGR